MTASDSRKVQKIVFDVVQDPIPRDCKLPMELSRDILRNMFAERFGYSDLTQNDIDALEGFIAIELARYNRECSYARNTNMHTSHRGKVCSKIRMNHRTGGIESAFLSCDGSYFTGREAISFNSDGFIGFCGWANDKNSIPFLVAFYRWVNEWLDNSFGGHYRELLEAAEDGE